MSVVTVGIWVHHIDQMSRCTTNHSIPLGLDMGTGIMLTWGMGYLERLRPIHREIIRRLVMGQRGADIALALGISESTISNLQKSELFQRELERMQGMRDQQAVDVSGVLQEIAPVALNVVERIMYSAQSDKVRLEAARDILNRAGYGTTSTLKLVSDTNYHQYSDEELEAILVGRLNKLNEGNNGNGGNNGGNQ